MSMQKIIQFKEKPLIFRKYSSSTDSEKLVQTLFTKMNSKEGLNELKKSDQEVFEQSNINFRLIAEYGNELIATITLMKDREFSSSKTVNVYSVVTSDPFQGSGVSTLLFEYAIGWVRKLHGQRIKLTTNVTNIRAQRFFNKMGLNEESRTEELIYYQKQVL